LRVTSRGLGDVYKRQIEQGQRNPAMREHTYTWDKAAELLWESIQQTLQHKK
jgi:hypothetical protein